MSKIDLIARKKFEDFLVELIERVNKFPKSQKFGLGDKLLKTAFLVMDEIIVIQLSDSTFPADTTIKKSRVLGIF